MTYRPSYEKQKEPRIIFSKAEDEKLLKLIERGGRKPNWKSISAAMRTRSPRQCRERYRNYLNPNIEHSEWTKEEDQTILNLFSIYGKQWKKISLSLPGRTGNSIRNRYHSLERQQLRLTQNKVPKATKTAPPEPKKQTAESSPDIPFDYSIFNSIQFQEDSLFFEESSSV